MLFLRYSIKNKDENGVYIEEKDANISEWYSKEYYTKDNKLFKTEVINNNEIIVVRYYNCINVEEALKEHTELYGDISADFMEEELKLDGGYKIRGFLYENGKLNYVREIYYDADDDIVKEVALNPRAIYEATMVEYYEYDDNKELIGITQKTMDGKVISHIEFS